MKRIIPLLFALLSIASNASADNLKVNAVTCTPGTNIEIPVELINTKTNYTQYQLSVVLPDGFELTKVKNGKRFSITPGRANRPDGSYIIMASQSVEYDDEGDPKPLKKISGTSGTLFTLNVNVPASASGTKTITMSGITFSDENAMKTKMIDVSVTITIQNQQQDILILSASPYGGQVDKGAKVLLTVKTTTGASVSGADVYYTLNGTTPTTNSTKYTSSGIIINDDCTLNAIAYKNGYEPSDVLMTTYSVSLTPKPNTTVAQVETCNGHSLFLMSDGTLWACGENSDGQLGDETTTYRMTPIKVMIDVASVAAGLHHTLIVKKDGTLLACGLNLNGQLGDGTKSSRYSPIYVMSDVAAVAVGNSHSLILKKDGSLWSCGANYYGELGDGTTTKRLSPIKISSDVASVAAGYSHSLFVKKDGTLWACGRNEYGQLGNGTTKDIATPIEIMRNVNYVTAGANHSLVIKKDGSIWGFGLNGNKQISPKTDGRILNPEEIDLSNVDSFAASYRHSFYLRKDGTLWVCGEISYNHFASVTETIIATNTPTLFKSDVSYVSTNLTDSSTFFFVKRDGSLWACGHNTRGQLGDGTATSKNTPVMIFDGKNWVGATAVNDVESQPDITGGVVVYSLSGQRLAAPQKGVNIIGGKKVVMK